ncbi:DUF748 domain-containing protein [bacterium]|nr:MAG: DUF748 domain-containing protein [bacterium]
MTGVSVYLYINRQDIFDKSIDKVLEDQLPKYIELDSLKVNLQDKAIAIKGFKLRNPEGFKSPYLVEIDNINSVYKQASEKNILHGISLSDIELSGARVFLERDSNGILNLEKMESVLQDNRPKTKPGIKTKLLGLVSYFLGPIKSISQLLQIEPVFNINKGALFFEDYYIDNKGYSTTIENIYGTIMMNLKRDFKGIDYLTSQGRGFMNAKSGQVLTWDTEYDPTKAKLTMSNTFDIQNVDFTHFQPYYDKYSPFIFKKGKASGRLIFNFDDAQIGSDNEILLSGLEIEQKEDNTFNRFWPTGAEDLYKYFSSDQGDVVFDFKIKGPMDEPRFYLGSKTKRALAYMVVDKIAGRIFKRDEDAPDVNTEKPAAGAPQEKKTKLERILDVLQGF